MTCIITMRSETYALRAQRAFSENGFRTSITKLDPDFSKKGCSYGIRIDCRHRAVASKLLNDRAIPYSDIKSL